MNVSVNFQAAAAMALFDQRFQAYRPDVDKTEAIYKQCNCHSTFDGLPETLFELYKSIECMPAGSVMIGRVSEADFIVIKSKVGTIMVYKDNTVLRYITEDQFSVCESVKRAGFHGNVGIVDTYEQLNHLFKIPDSYVNV